MQVQLTKRAVNELMDRSPTVTKNILIMRYDIEGCGCVVSGVIKLTEEKELSNKVLIAATIPDTFTIAYEKQYEWVYEESLIIDFNETTNSFVLKSPNQILNPRMRFFPLL